MRLDKLPSLRARARNRTWMLISIAIHAVVIGAALLYVPAPVVRTVRYIDLGAPSPEVPLPAYRGPGGGRAAPRGSPPRATVPARVPPASAAAPVIGNAVPHPAVAVDTGAGEGEADTLSADTHRRLGPRYGDGRLWVRVEDVARGQLPAKRQVQDVPTHVAKIDSALAEKIRSYLDTVPPDSFATRAAPKWTTQIAGKTWGIDGKWIYLGGIKIPTAVLALLPMPSGNYDAAMRAQQLQLMREDIMEAASRAANAAEFNKYVKELRQRKDEEHRAREKPAPPDTTSKPPPLIP